MKYNLTCEFKAIVNGKEEPCDCHKAYVGFRKNFRLHAAWYDSKFPKPKQKKKEKK